MLLRRFIVLLCWMSFTLTTYIKGHILKGTKIVPLVCALDSFFPFLTFSLLHFSSLVIFQYAKMIIINDLSQ